MMFLIRSLAISFSLSLFSSLLHYNIYMMKLYIWTHSSGPICVYYFFFFGNSSSHTRYALSLIRCCRIPAVMKFLCEEETKRKTHKFHTQFWLCNGFIYLFIFRIHNFKIKTLYVNNMHLNKCA